MVVSVLPPQPPAYLPAHNSEQSRSEPKANRCSRALEDRGGEDSRSVILFAFLFPFPPAGGERKEGKKGEKEKDGPAVCERTIRLRERKSAKRAAAIFFHNLIIRSLTDTGGQGGYGRWGLSARGQKRASQLVPPTPPGVGSRSSPLVLRAQQPPTVTLGPSR